MRAQLKRLHSPDVDLKNYWPEDSSCFSFLLQAFIGPENEQGDESFSFTVCSPKWLEQNTGEQARFGANHLILAEYDLGKIEQYLSRYCERCVGSSWQELAAKLARVGRWEFEDYRSSA
jgi:hypothetical protein